MACVLHVASRLELCHLKTTTLAPLLPSPSFPLLVLLFKNFPLGIWSHSVDQADLELTVILLPQPPGHNGYKYKPASPSALSTLIGSKLCVPSVQLLSWGVQLGGTFSGDPMESQHRPFSQPHGLLLAVPFTKEDLSVLLMATKGSVSHRHCFTYTPGFQFPGIIRGPFLEVVGLGKKSRCPCSHSCTPTCPTSLSLLSWGKD